MGQVRGKFSSVPIPGESVTLNASDLLSQARTEMDQLREELKILILKNKKSDGKALSLEEMRKIPEIRDKLVEL